MVDGNFDVDGFLKIVQDELIESIEENVPELALPQVLDRLPECLEHVAWSLSKSKPDAVDLLCKEIRRKVEIAYTVHPEHERRVILGSLRELLRELDNKEAN